MKIKLMSETEVILYQTAIWVYIKDVLTSNLNASISDTDVDNIYQNMKRFIVDGSAIVVCAIDADELLGFLWAYERNTYEERCYHITQFVVSDKCRSMGIGSQLLKFLKHIAVANGITKLELMASVGNTWAVDFYKKHGFAVERVCMTALLT